MDDTSNISEKKLVENVQKVTLLVNDAGLSKSTVLTSIAKEMRLQNKNVRISQIDLNDYVSRPHSLDKIKFERHEIEECIEFVSKMIVRGKIDVPNIRLQRQLIEASLRKKPSIFILFDGFDDISILYNEEYKENTTTVLVALKATAISQI